MKFDPGSELGYSDFVVYLKGKMVIVAFSVEVIVVN